MSSNKGAPNKVVDVRRHVRRTGPLQYTVVRPHKRAVHGALEPGRFTDFGKAAERGRWVIQEHDARRRGKHLDFRFDLGAGVATSFAARSLPDPGTEVRVIAQPDHPVSYMDYEGTLTGYGAGTVRKMMDEPVQVHEHAQGRVVFSVHGHRSSVDYALYHLGGTVWGFRNITPTRERLAPYLYKLKYGSTSVGSVAMEDEGELLSAKIDGAQAVVLLQEGRRPRAYSYRMDKDGQPIEYTHKLPGLFSRKVHGLGVPFMALRAEVFAVDRRGRAIPNEQLGAILNSGVWGALEKQRAGHVQMRLALHNVTHVGEQKVERAPYGEKLVFMERAVKAHPLLELAPMARSPGEKRKLVRAVEEKKHPLTSEGFVIHRLGAFRAPVKAKYASPFDVFIRGVYEGEGKDRGAGGGFTYSHTFDGPVVGRVGTGFSDAQRRDMWQRKDQWVGKVARVSSPGKFPSGALRAPAFEDFHWEKSASLTEEDILFGDDV